MDDAVVTYITLLTTFTDFLTIALHTLLYERALYPPTTFLSARKYNYPVRQSRHPRVCAWIADAVSAVRAELLKGTLARVALVVYSVARDEPLERFVFDCARFPVVPVGERETVLVSGGSAGESLAVLPRVDLEEQLRATMGRLAGCGARLGELGEECTFTLAVELREEGGVAPVGHPQPWIPVQPLLGGAGQEGGMAANTVPVRTVAAGDFIFECWIEEAEAKFAATGTTRAPPVSSDET